MFSLEHSARIASEDGSYVHDFRGPEQGFATREKSCMYWQKLYESFATPRRYPANRQTGSQKMCGISLAQDE